MTGGPTARQNLVAPFDSPFAKTIGVGRSSCSAAADAETNVEVTVTHPSTEFQYSEEFQRLIEALSASKRDWPNYRQYVADSLGSRTSRYAIFKIETLPEIAYHCGELQNQSVLDFGCGTGATTVALAEQSGHVVGFDIDPARVAICERRVREHGLTARVSCRSGRFRDQNLNAPGFDLVVLNGVLEHIPASEKGFRAGVLGDAAQAVRAGGHLFINDTPNLLFPLDLHTTQLWWIPWTKPGSNSAYDRAVRKGRYRDNPDSSPGSRGMEEAGAWGMTYWQVASILRRFGFVCVNLESGHDRRLRYVPIRANRFRGPFEALMYVLGTRVLRAPLTAFMPNLTNLVFRRQHANR